MTHRQMRALYAALNAVEKIYQSSPRSFEAHGFNWDTLISLAEIKNNLIELNKRGNGSENK